ncbi:DUF4177 domain-containing protein [Gymnodinialimonas ceratoperidinii]|uniref:DUF4177 domain-containing protein n=1 Tax=Gymnodinialimonas ceratoperidinii TaxID=2856823 RepID=A0A8F6TVK8_9RHOB|nr:DUF4177 domain-containing protein [Gymnodinialimonas ceratoperidinii]QXT38714.1 DUF4177 domain-containing protein [Gymnodinialimonas ceratoperidinii]
MRTEYKVVPAPEKARKQRGLKGAALFARSVEELMNEMAADGWTYLRADTLPQEERAGLTNKTTVYRNLLVFQRVVDGSRDESLADEIELEADADETPDEVGDSDDADEADNDSDEEVTNLWKTDDATPKPLVAKRQGQGVDL